MLPVQYSVSYLVRIYPPCASFEDIIENEKTFPRVYHKTWMEICSHAYWTLERWSPLPGSASLYNTVTVSETANNLQENLIRKTISIGRLLGVLDLRLLMPILQLGNYAFFPTSPNRRYRCRVVSRTAAWSAITPKLRANQRLHQQMGDSRDATRTTILSTSMTPQSPLRGGSAGELEVGADSKSIQVISCRREHGVRPGCMM